MLCCFNFRPVGQGGFFTGDFLTQDGPVFHFVYDCGSLTAGAHLANEIIAARNSFRIENGNPTVDMVIISHFDEDHVNGVIELLENVHCKLLVIPFMTIFERLTVYVRRGAKADWHRRLLQNPQAFFLENDFNIDQIIMIDGNGGLVNELPTEPLPLDTRFGSSPGVDDLEFMGYDAFTFNKRFVYMRTPLTLENTQLGYIFKFYIKSFPDVLIRNFQAELTRKYPAIAAASLFEDRYRLVIKGLYKDIFGNINKTSLCVSIRRPKWNRIWYHDDPNLLFDYDPRKTGFLLTGDSFLKSRRDRDAFLLYYDSDLSDTLVFQIPHHGSKANITLNPANRLWSFRVFAMQHGYDRRKHPSPELSDFIIAQHFQLFGVTELSGFLVRYTIT